MFSRHTEQYTCFSPVSCDSIIREARCTYGLTPVQRPSQSVCTFGFTYWGFTLKLQDKAVIRIFRMAAFCVDEMRGCGDVQQLQENFCVEFVRYGNATEAYKNAGHKVPSNKVAGVCAAKLPGVSRIQKHIFKCRDWLETGGTIPPDAI